MGMPDTTARWTSAQVRALPDDGNRYELIDGELIVTPAPARPHQAALRALFSRIDPYLQTTGAATIYWSPADLSYGKDEIIQPDLFVFPAGAGTPASWPDVSALLLAVEVLSPSTARYDRQLKRRRYQRAGVPEYWIVDTDARLIERWRPEDARPEILGERIVWQPDAGSAGLEIDLKELFAAIWGG
jgi:Uma2 family endonuclease